jgi:hypothetical protein
MNANVTDLNPAKTEKKVEDPFRVETCPESEYEMHEFRDQTQFYSLTSKFSFWMSLWLVIVFPMLQIAYLVVNRLDVRFIDFMMISAIGTLIIYAIIKQTWIDTTPLVVDASKSLIYRGKEIVPTDAMSRLILWMRVDCDGDEYFKLNLILKNGTEIELPTVFNQLTRKPSVSWLANHLGRLLNLQVDEVYDPYTCVYNNCKSKQSVPSQTDCIQTTAI